MLEEPTLEKSKLPDPSVPLEIEEVVCVPLVGESPKGGWSNEIKPNDSVHAIIAVHTKSGISGYGSTFTDGFLAREAVRVLRPLLINQNALEVGRLTEDMHQNTFWMGRGGTITHAVSGINIALWDVLGKATGLPISVLMGGRYKETVRPYASLLMDDPEKMGDVLAPYREQGYRSFKIGWGPFGRKDSYENDEAIIKAARRALRPEDELMVDAGGSDAYWPNGLKWALRTAEMLADYNVSWFEEALVPDDLAGFVELRRQSRVPIAGGEVLTRRQAFAPFLHSGAFDIVQPDVTKVGGITEQRRIAEWAEQSGVEYVGHGWNTALGIAADLQLASALPNIRYVEYIVGSRYVDGILETPFSLNDNGDISIPNTPGLGVDLDAKKLEGITDGLDDLRLP